MYCALRVLEVWRFEAKTEQIVIERLRDDGSYQRVEESALLPVRPDEVGRWVLKEDTRDGSLRGQSWLRGCRADRSSRSL
jgi:hypothetical protein